jgi:hypothetical protein
VFFYDAQQIIGDFDKFPFLIYGSLEIENTVSIPSIEWEA